MNRHNTQILIGRLWGCVHRQAPDIPHDKQSFCMSRQDFSCGSPACIGGHCADLMGKDPGTATHLVIEEFLDVEFRTAIDLFLGYFSERRFHEITPQDVIDYLEALLQEETA